ncbi:MAG: bacillithiol biosynthesis cysteine-adding enzyme BshC [Cytophagaceae bacterium]|nr:bacillithiol biosynthesis cysteine-adding enzyme BshC [Cytophagaceae bacterium]MDW8455395.1 bacillithiol biosynthesis cysteine-adding enzyme BshC [Cytophagaceae bacterium]
MVNVYSIPHKHYDKKYPLVAAYLNNDPSVNSFCEFTPSAESIIKLISQTEFDTAKRNILVDVLTDQYSGFTLSEKATHNLHALKHSNTFTITTGHQLCLFTGPLYFIYKIASVIQTAEFLNTHYKDFTFVPVFWMASEDHDFEEISSVKINDNVYTWHTNQKGAVGRYNLTDLVPLIHSIPALPELFKKAYTTQHSLASATRYLINELFGKYGLIVVDGDTSELKKNFATVMIEELLKQPTHKLVSETNRYIIAKGYQPQVNPREINLFYLDDNMRERIVKNENQYKVLNTHIEFSENTLLKIIESNPEKFSPNVLLRPLYQQAILPNVAYIGGIAELNYWLQLKSLFIHHHLTYPVLLPRHHVFILNKKIKHKLIQLSLTAQDILQDYNALKNKIIATDTIALPVSDNEFNTVKQLFSTLRTRLHEIDKSLIGHQDAQEHKVMDILHRINKKAQKAIKRKSYVQLNRLECIYNSLYPGGNAQERVDNMLTYYYHIKNFTDVVVRHLEAFNFNTYFFEYDE